MVYSNDRLLRLQRQSLKTAIETVSPVTRLMLNSQVQASIHSMVNASRTMNSILKSSDLLGQSASLSLMATQRNFNQMAAKNIAVQMNSFRSLYETMEPLIRSQDIKIASTSSQLLHVISDNPVESFNKIAEASSKTQKITANADNHASRNQVQLEKQGAYDSSSNSNLENSSDIINATVENYQKTINHSRDKNLSLKQSIDFFNYLFHFLIIVGIVVSMSKDTSEAFQLIENCLELITLWLEIRKTN